MIELHLNGQLLTLASPPVIAGTLDYLDVKIYKDSPEWDGLHLHVFFERGQTKYEILTIGDIGPEAHLNLGEGIWTISVVGYRYTNEELVTRITTNTIGLTVSPAPPIAGESMAGVPANVIEQIEAIARSVREDADAGKFNGEKGDAAFTCTVDETVTGDPGTDALVENVGTAQDLRLKFTIPSGPAGGVNSVNGMTGDVYLTADTIGAVANRKAFSILSTPGWYRILTCDANGTPDGTIMRINIGRSNQSGEAGECHVIMLLVAWGYIFTDEVSATMLGTTKQVKSIRLSRNLPAFGIDVYYDSSSVGIIQADVELLGNVNHSAITAAQFVPVDAAPVGETVAATHEFIETGHNFSLPVYRDGTLIHS